MDQLSIVLADNKALKEQVKDLTMRLSAIKVITTKITPVCSQKLEELMQGVEGCCEATHAELR